jgi:hypothetical protein
LKQFPYKDADEKALQEKKALKFKISKDFKSIENAYLAETNKNIMSELRTCNPTNESHVSSNVTEITEIPKCSADLNSYYADNKSKITPKQLTDLVQSKDGKAFSECVRNKIKLKYKLDEATITISSSSSQLKNTSTIPEIQKGEGFCGYDFKGLSNARALTARDTILPNLLKGIDLAPNDTKEKAIIDDLGMNGNGTSGPCPYDRSGKRNPSITDSVLKENRNSRIEIVFKKKTDSKSEPEFPGQWNAGVICSNVRISCKD